MTTTPPQGWYLDPAGTPNTYRYWSGHGWSEHTFVAGGYGSVNPPSVAAALPSTMVWPGAATVELAEPTRRSLRWETAFVMVAFVLPGFTSAAVLLVQHLTGSATETRFPVLIDNSSLGNMLLGMFAYLATASMVPLALLLLRRTGQRTGQLGLLRPGLRSDVGPAIGIAAASFGAAIAVVIPVAPFVRAQNRLVNPVPVGTVPHYYVLWGLLISAVTAVAEEVLMNGYLMTRLTQLGWTPGSALVLGMALRTSYHLYYGIAVVTTIPAAYFLTRSFQKRGRLTRPIVAHFLYDAVLVSIAVLAH